ncbi:MAG: SprB repeat-containing protein, partial [Methylophagaceae bacterium]
MSSTAPPSEYGVISNIIIGENPKPILTKVYNGISTAITNNDTLSVCDSDTLMIVAQSIQNTTSWSPNWQWYKNSSPMTGQINDTLFLQGANSQGDYWAVGSNLCLWVSDTFHFEFVIPAAPLSSSIISKNDVLCNGDSTGSITAQGTGGTLGSGYTYLWMNSSNLSVATSSVATGLSSGIYSGQVTDVNGCTHQINDTILEPSTAVSIATSGISNVLCFGGNTGSVWINPSGGVSPYSFNFNNLVTNDTIVNLVAGTYSVNVTDDNGCTENQSFSVTQPMQLTNSFTKSIYNGNTNVSCPGGTNGSIDLTPSGGSAPYTYLWSNTNTIQDINGLSAGTYSCTITDDNNCTSVANVSMTDPADFVWSSSIADVTCSGLDDGAINLAISGGNQPYMIDWISSSVSQGQVEVTFRLDMSQETSLTQSSVTSVIQGYSSPVPMSDLSNDSIFVLSSKFNPGDTIYWRYFNGSSSEIVPLSCGVNTSQSIFERFVVVRSNDTILPG